MFDAFADEATTATDLERLGSDVLATHPIAFATSPIGNAQSFDDMDTQKMPVDVRADLVRASQVDDGA